MNSRGFVSASGFTRVKRSVPRGPGHGAWGRNSVPRGTPRTRRTSARPPFPPAPTLDRTGVARLKPAGHPSLGQRGPRRCVTCSTWNVAPRGRLSSPCPASTPGVRAPGTVDPSSGVEPMRQPGLRGRSARHVKSATPCPGVGAPEGRNRPGHSVDAETAPVKPARAPRAHAGPVAFSTTEDPSGTRSTGRGARPTRLEHPRACPSETTSNGSRA